MTIRTSRRSRSRADGGAGMETRRWRPQRLEQSGCQGQALAERAAHQRDGAADHGPAGLDLERDVHVGLRAEAFDGECGRVGHHRDAPAQRREPAMAKGSGDLGFTAVHVGEDAFDRDRVGRERHGARDVAHDKPRIGDAGLAVAEGDPPVERRRPDGCLRGEFRRRRVPPRVSTASGCSARADPARTSRPGSSDGVGAERRARRAPSAGCRRGPIPTRPR